MPIRRHLPVVFSLLLAGTMFASADETIPPAVLRDSNRFAMTLLRRECETSAGSRVVSPPGVRNLLLFATAHAAGETRAALARASFAPEPPVPTGLTGDETASFASTIYINTDVVRPAESAKRAWRDYWRMKIVDTSFADPNVAFRQIAPDAAKTGPVPLSAADLASTRERDVGLMLVDETLFKGDWHSRFPKSATRPEKFTTDTGAVVEVPMMKRTHSAKYVELPDATAVRLYFQNDGYSAIFVLPAPGLTPAGWLAGKSGNALWPWTPTMKHRDVELRLPRFSMANVIDLKKPLTAAGAGIAFEMNKADFSGLGFRRPAAITVFRQGVRFKVDEDGADAGAVTTAVFGLAAGMGPEVPPAKLTFDRPFLFFLMKDDLILFAGRCAAPAAITPAERAECGRLAREAAGKPKPAKPVR